MHVGRQRPRLASSGSILFSFISLALGISMSVFAATPLPETIAKDIQSGYFHRALDQLQAIRGEHENDAGYQFRLGEALLGSSRLDDALKAMQAAVKLDPENGVYHRGLGDVYGTQAMRASVFSQFGLAKNTLREYQAAVKLAPDDVEAHVNLAMYYVMAPSIVGGSADKAHEQQAIIAKLDPVQSLLAKAQEAVGNEDAKQAETLFTQAAAQDKSTDSLRALGFFLSRQERYDDAIKSFQAATDKDAKDYLALYQIGRLASFAKAHYDEGIAALTRYLSVTELPDNMPSIAWAHFRRGNLHENQGNAVQAQVEYQQADKLKGEDEKLAKELSQRKL